MTATRTASPSSDLAGRLAAEAPLDLAAAFAPHGAVQSVADGVAGVVGLAGAGSEELVTFESGATGMALDLAPDRTGVVLLSGADRVRAGDGATPAGRLPSLPVSLELVGRVVDPLGRPLDGGPVAPGAWRSVFRAAPELPQRAAVTRPLLTGILAIDAAIPIGRGQRQLLVGDRNVGKTSLALDIVTAQRTGDVLCVYVLIGQPMSRILAIRESLRQSGALANTVVVAADAADAPGLQYLAPYAGTAVAEYARDLGRDALVVYDDLTKHADAYRELALLLGRPPGREAFPGDIFYVHAQLLERATALSRAAGGGSLTAFPIVETTDSDISSYIPTNLISITDGQIYLDTARFERNQRPAIDIGKSVSRIGGAAQPGVMRLAARDLRIRMARFESLESLTRVGLDVDPQTVRTVERGRILRELLCQPRLSPRPVADQVLALTAVSRGWLDGQTPAASRATVERAAGRARIECAELMAALDRGEVPPDGWTEQLEALFGGAETSP